MRRLIALAFIVLMAAAGAAQPSHAQSAVSFPDGTYIVGVDIPAGTYRSVNGDNCYWERLSGFGGTLDETIENDIAPGPAVVTILPSDAGFTSDRCGVWTSDLSPITSSPAAPFGDGTFIVGTDIAPGTWRSVGGHDCYWKRLSGFTGSLDDIIANDFSTIVTIRPGDRGFASDRCGRWTLVSGAANSTPTTTPISNSTASDSGAVGP